MSNVQVDYFKANFTSDGNIGNLEIDMSKSNLP